VQTKHSALSITERVGQQLREEIVTGGLLPGTQLVENDLARKYQASRNSIREVLNALVRDGLAVSVRYRGVFVRRFCENDLQDIYTARRTIQLHAIRTARDYTPAILEQIARDISLAEQAILKQDWRAVGTYSLAFHQNLVATLNSHLINVFFLNLCAQLRLIFTIGPHESIVQTPKWVSWEKEIFSHIKNKHYQAAEKELAAYLNESEQVLAKIVRQHQLP